MALAVFPDTSGSFCSYLITLVSQFCITFNRLHENLLFIDKVPLQNVHFPPSAVCLFLDMGGVERDAGEGLKFLVLHSSLCIVAFP